MNSRWADNEEDAAAEAQRKREKEEKKRAKLEKQRKLAEAEQQRHHEAATREQEANSEHDEAADGTSRPVKRRKVSQEPEETAPLSEPRKLLRFNAPEWSPSRHVDNFERLNHIEEGSYGWVSRAKEVATGEIVALKKLKMDNLNDGSRSRLYERFRLLRSQDTDILWT